MPLAFSSIADNKICALGNKDADRMSPERIRSPCGAGMVAPIGKDRPIARGMQAVVLAVPNNMQVPTKGARIKTSAWDRRICS